MQFFRVLSRHRWQFFTPIEIETRFRGLGLVAYLLFVIGILMVTEQHLISLAIPLSTGSTWLVLSGLLVILHLLFIFVVTDFGPKDGSSNGSNVFVIDAKAVRIIGQYIFSLVELYIAFKVLSAVWACPPPSNEEAYNAYKLHQCSVTGLMVLFILAEVVYWRRLLSQHLKRRDLLMIFDAYFRYLISNETIPFVLGAVASLGMLAYPLLAKIKWLQPDMHNYYWFIYTITFIVLCLAPAAAAWINMGHILRERFHKYISHSIHDSKGHVVFLGFGDLGNKIFLEYVRSGKANAERVVFPDGAIRYVFRKIIVTDKREALFSYTSRDSYGHLIGLVKPQLGLPGANGANDAGKGKIDDGFYLLGVMGDARFPSTLERASFAAADRIISTVPDDQAGFTAFDSIYPIAKA